MYKTVKLTNLNAVGKDEQCNWITLAEHLVRHFDCVDFPAKTSMCRQEIWLEEPNAKILRE